MKTALSALVLALTMNIPAYAENITYTKHIRPLWEEKCMGCHGPSSPYLIDFLDDKEAFIKQSRGPRMDTYANLVMFVGWPDTGALMRRLDDGKNTKNGQPGNMYQYLGTDEPERQTNLLRVKAWVGEGGWVLSKFKDLSKDDLAKMKVRE